MTVTALVLVNVGPGTEHDCVRAVRGVAGVVEAHVVVGPYDVIALLEAAQWSDVPILADDIRALPDVKRTTTCLVYARGGREPTRDRTGAAVTVAGLLASGTGRPRRAR